MAKQTNLDELSELIKLKEKYICKNITKVMLRDEIMSQRVGKEIMEFCAITDEVYIRLIEKEKGRRIKQNNLINELNYSNVSSSLVESLSKIKRTRNWLGHSVDITETLYSIFTKNLKGLAKVEKFRARLQCVSTNLIEDVQYSYIS